MVKNSIIATVAASTVTAIFGGYAGAAVVTFTGTTSTSQTHALGNGTYNYAAPYAYAGAVTIYRIDATGSNLSSAYVADDDLLFDGSASGSVFDIAVDGTIPTAGNPNSITFNDDNGAGKTYIFHRASTSASSAISLGFTGGTAGATVDSYSSTSFFGATTPSSGGSSLVLDSNFTGRVVLRTRANNAGAGTTTINGGTLELHDAGALPTNGANSNNPGTVTLNGGTLVMNINEGNEETAEGSRNASTAQLNGTLAVTANSTLRNGAKNFDGTDRRQDLWGGSSGPITLSNGVTLNIETGSVGGTIKGSIVGPVGGSATVNLGSSNGYLRLNATGGGSALVNYNLGSGDGELQLHTNGTYNLGHVQGASTTVIRGGQGGADTTATIGNLGLSTNYGGQLLNGYGASTGGATAPAGSVRLLNVSKVGAGTLTLSNENRYSGTTAVSNGTLRAGSTSAFGDSAAAITASGTGTLDLNGFTQEAGRNFTLSGGSLVNNGASPVNIHSGASAGVNTGASGTVAGAGTVTGSGPSDTGSWSINGGTTPTVSISGTGTGATAIAKLQVGWMRLNAAGGLGTTGSGYTKAPTITFSAPEDPNGRAAVAYVTIGQPGSASAGQVTGIQIVDPGWGYTSVPTLTINNTGTGGSGFAPVFAMQVNEIEITNAGTGYTAAPTVTVSNLGTIYNSGSGGTPANATPLATGGFGQVNVTATSGIGGSGNINVSVGVNGAGGLNKIGLGTVTFSGTNAYAGATDVQAGKLLVNGANNGTGAVTVQSGATLGGTGSIAGAVTVNTGGIVSPGASIESLDVASATIIGTLLAEYDATGAGSADVLAVAGLLTLDPTSILDLDALGGPADDGAYIIATYGTLSGAFGSVLDLPSGYSINYTYGGNSIAVVIPEPTTLGLLGLGSVLGLRRRRR